MKKTMAIAMIMVAMTVGGCGGQSPTAPTAGTPTHGANPLVTIQVAYNCHPCANEHDNYAIYVDCNVSGACQSHVYAENWLREENTMTWTGRLAPGKHNFEVRVVNVERAVSITFPHAG